MSRLARLPAALLLSLGAATAAVITTGAASAAPAHFGPPQSAVTLSARAGVGGIARPGRWLPVDVVLASDTGGTTTELRVEWGDAVALRTITVEAGTQHVALLLRAIAASPVVHVSMTSDAAPTVIDVPVELASLEDPLTLCVGDVGNRPCTVRVSDDAAPATWRGFDVADFVVWPSAPLSLHRDATRAFDTWRAMRWLGDRGPSDPVSPPFDSTTPGVSSVTTRLAILGLVTWLLTSVATWRRAPVALALAVPVLAAFAAAVILSPLALARDNVTAMSMTGVVHQFANTAQSTVSAKANLEHSSAAPLWVHVPLHDATLAASGPATTRSVSAEDRDGHAVYAATAGLGTRKRLNLDGTIDENWLNVAESVTGVWLRNQARFPLNDCHWSGSLTNAIGTLAAGATFVTHPASAPVSGDTIVCTLPNDWLPWTSSGTRVEVRGQMYFVFHFWSATP
jgi:hypothetical protein